MIESVSCHRRCVFVGDFPVRLDTNNFYRCSVPSCPFCVLLRPSFVNGQKKYQLVKYVFSKHCHEPNGMSRKENKAMVQRELIIIRNGQDRGAVLEAKHDEWQQDAVKNGRDILKKLVKQERAIAFACEHPDATGREVEKKFKNVMTRFAIDVARKRKMERDDDYDFGNIIRSKKHHILTSDEENIVIFGDDKAIERLAASRTIHADGTFKCVLPGFSQLYIFHATVENNLSLPVLFCLVKGKDEPTYTKLLGLVEQLAIDAGLRIFTREVTLMCDFEQAFIVAVQLHYGSVVVKCCFFHFVQNLRKNATKTITAVKRATGKRSEKRWLAEKTKRRPMLLPLVPAELISPGLISLIIASWKEGCKELPDAFEDLEKTVLRTYVGKPVEGTSTVRPPLFPPALWNVSGMVSRTNNAAESVHAQMNSEVHGKLSVFGFLSIIEHQMERTNDRIAAGCQPETRAVETVKNELLAVELEKLLNRRQGVLCFLDNCGSIVQMKSVNQANKFVRAVVSSVDDIEWMLSNQSSIVATAHALHRRLCPESQVVGDEVLKSVAQWAFQVPPGPTFHVGASQVRMSLVDRGQRETSEDEDDLEDEACQVGQTIEHAQVNETPRETRIGSWQPRERIVYYPVFMFPRVAPVWDMPFRRMTPWFNPYLQR